MYKDFVHPYAQDPKKKNLVWHENESFYPISMYDICPLLQYYEAYGSNSIPNFRDNLSVPSSRVKKSKNIQTRRVQI